MQYHPTDPSLFLVECGDLESDNPPAVVRDNAAVLSRTLQWARDYLCKPHAELGRAGAVCPYVEMSITQRHFYLTTWPDEDVTLERVYARGARYCEWFPRLEPCAGPASQFKTILMLFPQPDVADILQTIERVQRRLKAQCVEQGLMVGEFHPGPPRQPGLWNREFRPFASPIPLIGIRNMVPADFTFLEDDPSMVRQYLRRFGHEVPPHLRGRVHDAASRFGIRV
jgi:hypothetical protein